MPCVPVRLAEPSTVKLKFGRTVPSTELNTIGCWNSCGDVIWVVAVTLTKSAVGGTFPNWFALARTLVIRKTLVVVVPGGSNGIPCQISAFGALILPGKTFGHWGEGVQPTELGAAGVVFKCHCEGSGSSRKRSASLRESPKSRLVTLVLRNTLKLKVGGGVPGTPAEPPLH